MRTATPRGHRHRISRFVLTTALVLGIAAPPVVGTALADPPPWAPAHGWRAKHKQKPGRRDTAREPEVYYDYAPRVGILSGHCSREVIGSMIGAAGGGYIGAQVGKGDAKLAAVGAGVFLGALLGGAIGREMDAVDQNCVGHALESAEDGHGVAWNNAAGAQVTLTPQHTFRDTLGRYCREYITQARIDGRNQRLHGTSCRQADGSWVARN